MSKPTAAQTKTLDLIANLPGLRAKVATRGNADKGVVSKAMAESLVKAGLARMDGTSVVLVTEEPRVTGHPEPQDADDTTVAVPAKPDQGPAPAKGKGKQSAKDKANNRAAAKKDETGDPAPAKAKVNGRKAAAEKSPYSTAPVAGYVKREGKSRRTGTETRIVDLLHPKAEFTLEGSGRYAIQCLTHATMVTVPDMTAAKPIQARTDQFCPKCKALVDKGEKYQAEAPANA